MYNNNLYILSIGLTQHSCVHLPAPSRGMGWQPRIVRASCGKARREHLRKATGNHTSKIFRRKNMAYQNRTSILPPASEYSPRLDGGQRATRVTAVGARTVCPPNWKMSGGSSPLPAERIYEGVGPNLNRSSVPDAADRTGACPLRKGVELKIGAWNVRTMGVKGEVGEREERDVAEWVKCARCN